MIDKCDLNLSVAHVLSQDRNNKDGWTTSIHCSYYAVFQYMKYLLAEKVINPISYEDQNKQKGDSHKFILTEIKNRIGSSDTARKIRDRILNLQQHRVDADYKPKIFTQAEALTCKSEADAIIKNLKTLFRA